MFWIAVNTFLLYFVDPKTAQTYVIPLSCLIGNPSGKFNVDFFLPALIAA